MKLHVKIFGFVVGMAATTAFMTGSAWAVDSNTANNPNMNNMPGVSADEVNPNKVTTPEVTPDIANNQQAFLTKLHAANQFEIAMGKLGQEKGTGNDVKNFGKRLVDDHTNADKEIIDYADAHKINLNAAPTGNSGAVSNDQQAKLDSLNKMSGNSFDKEYLSTLKRDHDKDVKEVQAVIKQTRDQDFKNLLSGILPKLQHHDTIAASLEKRYRGKK